MGLLELAALGPEARRRQVTDYSELKKAVGHEPMPEIFQGHITEEEWLGVEFLGKLNGPWVRYQIRPSWTIDEFFDKLPEHGLAKLRARYAGLDSHVLGMELMELADAAWGHVDVMLRAAKVANWDLRKAAELQRAGEDRRLLQPWSFLLRRRRPWSFLLSWRRSAGRHAATL
jgi:hypothetical protein